jgi:hypothetical protein
MAVAGGFFLAVTDGGRKNQFEKSIEDRGYFAEAVAEFNHSRTAALICFVSFEQGLITHIARGKRGLSAGTGLRRLNFQDLFSLSSAVRIDTLLNQLPSRSRHFAQNIFLQGGLFPKKTFTDVVDAFIKLSPESRPRLARFGEDHRRLVEALSEKDRDALAYQREGVATALGIAGIDRARLLEWTVPEKPGHPTSYLEGLPFVRAREDTMVNNDLQKVPGYDLVKRLPHDAAIFEGDGTRLTVLVTNRLPLEEQFGTDLIYFNETFKCFLMVQYKAMENENGEAVFRFPKDDLTKEIGRMRSVLDKLKKLSPDNERHGFRFSDNPFFLKLCPRIIFNPDSTGLVPGMYLPLDYWTCIENSKDMVGPSGGQLVTFRNVGRWLDNTGFILLVRHAWVGTTPAQSIVLEEVIRTSIAAGRAVMLAVEIDEKEPEVSESAESLLEKLVGDIESADEFELDDVQEWEDDKFVK